jgi:hypothetical protein
VVDFNYVGLRTVMCNILCCQNQYSSHQDSNVEYSVICMKALHVEIIQKSLLMKNYSCVSFTVTFILITKSLFGNGGRNFHFPSSVVRFLL